MKKALSIALSVMLILSTLTCLMVLPANAAADALTDDSYLVNIIKNGDASGIDTNGDGVPDKETYSADECTEADLGFKYTEGSTGTVTYNPYYWYHNNTNYRDFQVVNPSANSNEYVTFSSNKAFQLNRWHQAFQNITLEQGKTYTVSAKITSAYNYNSSDPDTMAASNYKFGMFIDAGKTVANTSIPSNKDWSLSVNYEWQFAKHDEANNRYYYHTGDFKEYSFTFSADDFLAANTSVVVDENGFFNARFAMFNNQYTVFYIDDISIYESVAITAADGGEVSSDYAIIGELSTVTATPWYGNTFAGWYDKDNNLVSSFNTYTGYIDGPLTAKFNVYNLFKDGNFEGSAAIDYLNSLSSKQYTTLQKNFSLVADPSENIALHGNKVLSVGQQSPGNGQKQLITIPVTVEKGQSYVFQFSFYYPETVCSTYITVGNTHNKWGSATPLGSFSYHFQREGIPNENEYSYVGAATPGYVASHERLNQGGWYPADQWVDAWFAFNAGTDTTLFPEGVTETTLYIAIGPEQSTTQVYDLLLDNISISKAASTPFNDPISVFSGDGGSITSVTQKANLAFSQYDTNGGENATAPADKTVANSVIYAQMSTNGGAYTAVPNEGNIFVGWEDPSGEIISTRPTEVFYTPGNYKAVFKIVPNLWGNDPSYENYPTGVELLLDKTLYNGTYEQYSMYTDWYSATPSEWWRAQVVTDKAQSGSKSIRLTHRLNEVMRDVTGLEPKTEYEFSFWWYGDGDIKLTEVNIYDGDGIKILDKDYSISADGANWKKQTVRFYNPDNTDITVGLMYTSSSASIYLDNMRVAKAGPRDGEVMITYQNDFVSYRPYYDFAPAGSTYTLKSLSGIYFIPGESLTGWKDDATGESYGKTGTMTLGTEDVTLYPITTKKGEPEGAFSTQSSYNPQDYTFSLAILPDTQRTNIYYPGYMYTFGEWLKNNKNEYKIAGVATVGDITETDSLLEWRRAYNSFKDVGLPFAFAAGNHDYVGGRNHDGAVLTTSASYYEYIQRNVGYMNYTFKPDDIWGVPGSQTFEGELTNSYYTISPGGNNKYLVMSLEIFPRDEVLEWAGEVAKQYSDHKVIVLTHAYLNADGTRMESLDGGGADTYRVDLAENTNNANQMWDKFVSQHPNILLMIGGHNSNSATVCKKAIGVHGNTVYELLIDNQDDDHNLGTSNIVLLGFDETNGVIGTTNVAALRSSITGQNVFFYPEKNEYTEMYLNDDVSSGAEFVDGGFKTSSSIKLPITAVAKERHIGSFTIDVSEATEFYLGGWSEADMKITVSTGKGKVYVFDKKDVENHVTFRMGEGIFADATTAQVYVELDAYNFANKVEGTIYIGVGDSENAGSITVTDIEFIDQDTLVKFGGGALGTTEETEDMLSYTATVNLPEYLTVKRVATYMASTTALKNYQNGAYLYTFDDTCVPADILGVAQVVASDYIKDEEDNAFLNGTLYTYFKGASSAAQTALYSARTVVYLADMYGNDIGISIETQNNNSNSKIIDGTYQRSIRQIRRLAAKDYLTGYSGDIKTAIEAKAAELITDTSDADKWNCDIEQVWAFVKAAYGIVNQ